MTARRLRFDIRAAGGTILVVLGIWLVVVLGFYLGVVRGKVEEYRTLRDGGSEKFQALQEHAAAVEGREAFLEALKKLEKDLRYLRTEVLNTRVRRMVEVQSELASLCKQFRIDLDSVSYDHEILAEEELDRMVMVVPLEGSYINLRNFLQAAENSDKFLVVEQVALGEGKEGGVELLLNITLATYFDLPEELRKAKPKPAPRRPAGGRA